MSGVTLCAMTDVDRADVDGWLARAEQELGAVALEPPARLVDTSSAVLLHTSFKPGAVELDVALTVYRDYGRVRVDVGDAQPHDAETLRSFLADALELAPVVAPA